DHFVDFLYDARFGWVDWELTGADRADVDRFQARVQTHRPGFPVAVYSWRDWVVKDPGDDAAVASYGLNDGRDHGEPTGVSRLRFHQYTSSGAVPGLAGRVDRDHFLGDRAALTAWTGE